MRKEGDCNETIELDLFQKHHDFSSPEVESQLLYFS